MSSWKIRAKGTSKPCKHGSRPARDLSHPPRRKQGVHVWVSDLLCGLRQTLDFLEEFGCFLETVGVRSEFVESEYTTRLGPWMVDRMGQPKLSLAPRSSVELTITKHALFTMIVSGCFDGLANNTDGVYCQDLTSYPQVLAGEESKDAPYLIPPIPELWLVGNSVQLYDPPDDIALAVARPFLWGSDELPSSETPTRSDFALRQFPCAHVPPALLSMGAMSRGLGATSILFLSRKPTEIRI